MGRTRLGVALAALLALASLIARDGWLVEEAAVPLAYAQNVARGHGLVAWPGAPWVEGFDSPLWVALLALPAWAGLDGPTSAQALGGALAVLAVALTGAAYARLGGGGAPAVAAALVMAVLPATARWGASGTEHALFHALLAGLLLRRTHELRHGGTPWSPALVLGLALTRYDGAVYALVAGALLAYALTTSTDTREARRWWAFALAAAATPLVLRAALYGGLVSHIAALRLGWGGTRSARLSLDGRGVSQLLGAAPMWLGPVSLGLLASLRPDTRRVALVAGPLVAVAAAQHVAVGGDWLRGDRWLALAGVPLALLAGAGFHACWTAPVPRLGRPVGVAAIAIVVAAIAIDDHREGPETRLTSANVRVRYLQTVHRSLRPGTPLTTADVDAGPFALADVPVLDLSGLLDPLASPSWDAERVRRHLLDEARPTFVHLHGSPFHTLGIERHPAWSRDYVQLPPYPIGTGLHVGTYVRRDALPSGPLPLRADAPQHALAAD